MARAARLTGLTSLVRLFDRKDWVVERYMGRGVGGIVVPRLEAPDEAAAVVEAVRYCYPKAHTEKVVVIQIETRQALAALDDFIALPGIDVLFLGPVDLAKSLGDAGDYRHPDVQEALKGAVRRIAGAGKAPAAIDILVKDLSLVADLGAELHARLPMTQSALGLFTEASSKGMGARNDSEIIRLLRESE